LDVSSWRFAFNGAEPVSPETMAQFEQRFAKHGFGSHVMSPVYGLAEASVGLAFTPPGERWQVDLAGRQGLAGRHARSRALRVDRPGCRRGTLRSGAVESHVERQCDSGTQAARGRRG